MLPLRGRWLSRSPVALLFYKMPVDHALASVVYGFFYGLWPIAWIIIAAVFVYKISVQDRAV
ncbi:L-lactate permease [Salmonella enterica subsp. enterica]|nr:L-lactate permease [Salmonella enterica subsp. enterica] [Salmonella enterica subsp. enterica serovar Menston]